MIIPSFKKFEKGFTLIELLIVVSLIGIIATIAIGMLGDYRTRTFNAAAMADLKNSRLKIEAYELDNKIYPY